MNCARCGVHLDHPGQGHSCAGGPVPVIRPPLRWQLALGLVLLLAVGLALLSSIRAAIAADAITAPSWLPVRMLSVVVPVALFVSFGLWANVTKRIVVGAGGMVAVVRNWAMSLGALILFLAYLLPMKAPAGFHVARAAGAILLMTGLLISRGKLHRWLVEPADVAPPAAPPSAAINFGSRIGPVPSAGLRIGQLPPPVPQPEDWDAARWDPEIQRHIERRRRSG